MYHARWYNIKCKSNRKLNTSSKYLLSPYARCCTLILTNNAIRYRFRDEKQKGQRN